MATIGFLPAAALVVGVWAGLAWPWPARLIFIPLAAALLLVLVAHIRGWGRVAAVALAVGFAACGAINAAHARDGALDTQLRRVLDAEFGGFAIDAAGTGGAHAPVPTRARLNADASLRDGYASLDVVVQEVRLRGGWRAARGRVRISVSGAASAAAMSGWRAGRTIEVPITFRRPARYLNDGVDDFERDLALDGTTLLGSVKSALLVEVRASGTPLAEAASAARARVRAAVGRWVGARSPTSAALVTAVLIGDRAAIADDVSERLRAAGTYHVIAISGGNIAVFVVLVSALAALGGLGPRPAAVVTIAVLLAYAAIVVTGPAVRRAVLVAVVYLVARAFDHRAPAWQACAIACAGSLVVWPLDLRDAGFVLTFGAAGALLAVSAAAGHTRLPAGVRWLAVAMAASAAVEAVLLPVQAFAFGRVTLAGIVLNLAAVPLMAVAQLAGLAAVALDLCGVSASWPAWAADVAVRIVLGTASTVDVAPWFSRLVRPPTWPVVTVYYMGLAVAARAQRIARAAGACLWMIAALVIVIGRPAWLWPSSAPAAGDLRLTMLDVGQGESILIEPPGGAPLLVDTGGSPFGSTLDVGARVVVPALWARGVDALETVLITHGDPDHLGGAAGVLARLAVGETWLGIPVPGHGAGEALLSDLARRHTRARYLRAGEAMQRGGLRLRVLNPPEPDWERRRVRNDDSVVIEVVYGDVAMLLTGDISAEVERAIAPRLTPARLRVLKVAHHGSRTSTSHELLEAWRPQLALVSAGRGNSFGHPARDVLERLEAAGARVLRTDRDGQITVTSDGRTVLLRTFNGERFRLSPEP